MDVLYRLVHSSGRGAEPVPFLAGSGGKLVNVMLADATVCTLRDCSGYTKCLIVVT